MILLTLTGQYIANACRGMSCKPCQERFGSCKGFHNGLQQWPGRENTPYFLVCKDQRVVFHSKCISPNTGMNFILDTRLHTCILPKGGYKFP